MSEKTVTRSAVSAAVNLEIGKKIELTVTNRDTGIKTKLAVEGVNDPDAGPMVYMAGFGELVAGSLLRPDDPGGPSAGMSLPLDATLVLFSMLAMVMNLDPGAHGKGALDRTTYEPRAPRRDTPAEPVRRARRRR